MKSIIVLARTTKNDVFKVDGINSINGSFEWFFTTMDILFVHLTVFGEHIAIGANGGC